MTAKTKFLQNEPIAQTLEVVKYGSPGDDKEPFCSESQQDETSREAGEWRLANKLARPNTNATVAWEDTSSYWKSN